MPSPAAPLRAPLLWVLFPLMVGLTLAKLFPPPALGLKTLAILAALLGAASILVAGQTGPRFRWAWALLLPAAVTLGGFVLLHYRNPQLHEQTSAPPREVSVTLRVNQLFPGTPGSRSYSGLAEIVRAGDFDRGLIGRRIYFSAIRKVSVTPVRSGWYAVTGVIETLPPEPDAMSFNGYLDNLGLRQQLIRARLVREEKPPGGFRRFCARTESRLEFILGCGLSRHPEARSLYLAMLLGQKAVLSRAQQDGFMRSGTFHIFSISGLHVGVIAVALQSVLRLLRAPRGLSIGLSLAFLWLYLEITGINSPSVRSFVMIAFLLTTRFSRLPGNALAALAAAALTTLLIDPLQLFSTGFQMSYSVVAALVLMGVPLTEKCLAWWRPFSARPTPLWRWYHKWIEWCGRWLISSLAAGWVAFLASIPSGIGYFQLLSPGSLAANLVIIPLSSLAIISGFISLLAGLAGLPSLSALFNSAAALVILTMDWLIQHGTRLPGTYFTAQFVRTWIAPTSLALMTAVLLFGHAHGWSRRYGGFWAPAVLLVGLLIAGVKFG